MTNFRKSSIILCGLFLFGFNLLICVNGNGGSFAMASDIATGYDSIKKEMAVNSGDKPGGGLQSLSYEAIIDSAENLTGREEWERAEQFYREALRLKPASPLNSKLFANLGICLTYQGNYKGALEYFDIALIKEPDSPSILTSKSSAQMLNGDIDSAESGLAHAIASDSLYPSALRLHGQIMLLKNRLDEAESDFRQLCKADPTDSWGPGGMAEVLMAKNMPKDAIDLYIKALTLLESADFRISLIAAQMRADRYADAENSIREALVVFPEQGEFYLLRSILHKTLHQNRDAEIDKKYAIEHGVDPQMIEKYIRISQ